MPRRDPCRLTTALRIAAVAFTVLALVAPAASARPIDEPRSPAVRPAAYGAIPNPPAPASGGFDWGAGALLGFLVIAGGALAAAHRTTARTRPKEYR